MSINLYIDYYTEWGQSVWVVGSSKELGEWDECLAIPMQYTENSRWWLELKLDDTKDIEYKYLIKEGDTILRREAGFPHLLNKRIGYTIHINDSWQDKDENQHLYTSAFSNSFYAHYIDTNLKLYDKTLLLNVKHPLVKKNFTLCISGSTKELGEWKISNVLKGSYQGNGTWAFALDLDKLNPSVEYKFLICDNAVTQIVEWETGDNRRFNLYSVSNQSIIIENLQFRFSSKPNWRAAGLAIPVFSLRSKDSCGVGDFLDLRKAIDWAVLTDQKVIQILPINDTTSTFTNSDSYPYSAISIYALHPIYIGLSKLELKNKAVQKKYTKEFELLNSLEQFDYEKTIKTKLVYLRDLYCEIGDEILSQPKYKKFHKDNEYWLYPYACFCYLRDKFKSAEIRRWGEFGNYNEYKINKLTSNKAIEEELKFTYFCQYLLHEQLTEVRNYAHQNGVILKGDIPIGVDPNSVDVWIEPHLFNLDTQTGAPPDDFAEDGQNWGFPTYNWNEMAKDGYQWWVKRFRKMADYFDAYRIDHILGFFRIWEIPSHSVHGLLGYFNPALPYSIAELNSFGFEFDAESMLSPFITDDSVLKLFGDKSDEIKFCFLVKLDNSRYRLKEEFDTQVKIRNYFEEKKEQNSDLIRDGLYQLCNEVLFVKDKYNTEQYHPRISAYKTSTYKALSEQNRRAFDQLYNHFYYERHNDFWKENAMRKLPRLISATRMLTCGEDLGMIPDCVPQVMQELQILSLEIERMPKAMTRFADLGKLPYLSVCTTSTHDMSPIKEWWLENQGLTQEYYNEVLHMDGEAPNECTIDLCRKIIVNHLNSPSILAILPLQDWLSIHESYRKIAPASERINIPADANHYWGYRIHINIEKLIKDEYFSNEIKLLIKYSHRMN